MVTSYSRHKGIDRIGPRWPVPVQLKADELFSTWLIRVAFAQGCEPLVLAAVLWPRWRVWTIDLDRNMTVDRLTALATMTGEGTDALEAATLRPIAMAVGARQDKLAVLPWVLAMGARNRRRCGGLQFCPICFQSDRWPYYRRHWRLAWHTACSLHGNCLLDHCGHCGATLEPYRLSLPQDMLSTCSSCGKDLRACSAMPAEANALAFQHRADDVVKYGRGNIHDILLPAADWFALCRYFLMLVRTATRCQSSKLADWLTALGIEVAAMRPAATGLAFELLPARERAVIISAVSRLLLTDPKRLLEVARSLSVAADALQQGRQDLPYPMCDVVASLPQHSRRSRAKASDRKNTPLSPKSVLRKWARLQRKMGRFL